MFTPPFLNSTGLPSSDLIYRAQVGKGMAWRPTVRENNAPSMPDPTHVVHWSTCSETKPQMLLKVNAYCQLCKDCQIST